MTTSDTEKLRPHPRTGDEATISFRAKHLRAVFAERDALLEQVRIAHEALRPFARRADSLGLAWKDDESHWSTDDPTCPVTVGDLRKASQAIAYVGLSDGAAAVSPVKVDLSITTLLEWLENHKCTSSEWDDRSGPPGTSQINLCDGASTFCCPEPVWHAARNWGFFETSLNGGALHVVSEKGRLFLKQLRQDKPTLVDEISDAEWARDCSDDFAVHSHR